MNTRFSVATHILTFLHTQGGQPATSELIASSVNTNPSLIRRLLSQLARAELTTSRMGASGGALLARAADRITLLDVHKAIDEEGGVFALHKDPNPLCPVGRNIHVALRSRIAEAERALHDQLARTTIADMVVAMEAIENGAEAHPR